MSDDTRFVFLVGNKSSSEVLGVESIPQNISEDNKEWRSIVRCRDRSKAWESEISSNSVFNLKSENNSLMSDEDWAIIVRWVVCGDCIGVWPGILEGIEIQASWDDDRATLDVISSYEGGIYATLGTISLSRINGVQVTPWEKWLIEFGRSSRKVRQRQQMDSAALHVLERQRHELVTAKKQYEEELLARCAALINEKKKKINELLGYGDSEDDGDSTALHPEKLDKSVKVEQSDGAVRPSKLPAQAETSFADPLVKSESEGDNIEPKVKQESQLQTSGVKRGASPAFASENSDDADNQPVGGYATTDEETADEE
jgi:hypothetical protein